MAQALNALIPMGVKAPDVGNALIEGLGAGNALAMAPQKRRLLEAQAAQAEAIAANGGISPYQSAQLEIARAGLGMRAAEMNRPDWRQNAQDGSFYDAKDPSRTVGGGSRNPFYDGKMNEGQAKAAGFADRIADSNKTLAELENTVNEHPVQAGAQSVLGSYATPFISADLQKLDQAKRNFINAVLRRESGAAISPTEFDSAEKQYFPQYGEGPEVIAEKRANRERVLAGIARESGPNYAPEWAKKSEPTLPAGWTMNPDGSATDPNGEIHDWVE